MKRPVLPPEFLEALSRVKSKRANLVAQHIVEHGAITTDDIRQKLGYKDPYRPTMDLRDEGIPLESFKIKTDDGRTISGYRFGDVTSIRDDRHGGRKSFSKGFKQDLIDLEGSRCAVCLDQMDARYLQIDHRVPYHVVGDMAVEDRQAREYMLLCGSCNRAKSWSCENCDNYSQVQNPDLCRSCYWASPTKYTHIALRSVRRVDITWSEDEITDYEAIHKSATDSKMTIGDYIKLKLLASARDQA